MQTKSETIFPKLSMRANFSWTMAGNVVYAICQWGIFVVLAKLGTPDMVGQISLAFAITAPISLFTDLKLRSIQATDSKKEYLFGDYLATRIITIGFFFLFLFIIVLFSNYNTDSVVIIISVAIAKAFDSLSDISYGFLQQHERMKRIAISRIIQGLVQSLVFAIIIFLFKNIMIGAIFFALASCLVTILYDINSVMIVNKIVSDSEQNSGKSVKERYYEVYPRWDKEKIIKLIKMGLPLGLAVASTSFYINIPKYFIKYYLGITDLGIFSALSYIIVGGGLVINALSQSASPRLARYWVTQNLKEFDDLFYKLIVLGVSLGILIMIFIFIFGKNLILLFYSSVYAEKFNILILVVLSSCIQYGYVFCGTAISAMRNFKVQLPIQTISTFIVLSLSYLFIKDYGLIGAGWAMLVVSLFEAIAYVTVFSGLRKVMS